MSSSLNRRSLPNLYALSFPLSIYRYKVVLPILRTCMTSFVVISILDSPLFCCFSFCFILYFSQIACNPSFESQVAHSASISRAIPFTSVFQREFFYVEANVFRYRLDSSVFWMRGMTCSVAGQLHFLKSSEANTKSPLYILATRSIAPLAMFALFCGFVVLTQIQRASTKQTLSDEVFKK